MTVMMMMKMKMKNQRKRWDVLSVEMTQLSYASALLVIKLHPKYLRRLENRMSLYYSILRLLER